MSVSSCHLNVTYYTNLYETIFFREWTKDSTDPNCFRPGRRWNWLVWSWQWHLAQQTSTNVMPSLWKATRFSTGSLSLCNLATWILQPTYMFGVKPSGHSDPRNPKKDVHAPKLMFPRRRKKSVSLRKLTVWSHIRTFLDAKAIVHN